MTDTPNASTDAPTVETDTAAIDALIGFDEAATLAEVTDYNPDRLIAGTAAPARFGSGQEQFALSMLGEGSREFVLSELSAISDPAQRAAAEPRLVQEEMVRLAKRANIMRGHPNGNLHDREMAAILNEQMEVEDSRDRLEADLDEIDRYETERDINGKATAVPVYRINGYDREVKLAELEALNRRVASYDNLDASAYAHRLSRAANAEVAQRRAQAVEASKLKEAKRRAGISSLDAEIDRLADGFRSLANRPD